MENLSVQKVDDGVVFAVKVLPGSSKTAISGLHNSMLKIKVAAPAEKGKANKYLLEFLAKELGVKKNAVCIISGKTNPIKHIQIQGLCPETLLNKLNLNKTGLK